MSTHNIGFYEDLTKIIFELSSNMHLISSAAGYLPFYLLTVKTDKSGWMPSLSLNFVGIEA